MRFPVLRFQTQHKFVRQLKKFLNELVSPPRNLPLDDVFDEKTIQAVITFKVQWVNKVSSDVALRGKQPAFDGTVTSGTWAMIGKALMKHLGRQYVLNEIKTESDYELKSLLLGIDAVGMTSTYYTREMEICDAKIASIFGGENAIAAANGFDPYSFAVARVYPGGGYQFYRGDFLKEGKIETGHLSVQAMHLYGSIDGTRFGVDGYTFTDLYAPDGFRNPERVRKTVSPNSASVDFYYPKLGNYTDVTLLISHIKNYKLVKQRNRWHIGQIGGNGGQTPGEIHAHLDLFKGDVGMTGPRNRLSFAKAFCP